MVVVSKRPILHELSNPLLRLALLEMVTMWTGDGARMQSTGCADDSRDCLQCAPGAGCVDARHQVHLEWLEAHLIAP